MTVVVADCIEHMRTLPEHSVDAVVCDPPYGLEFMGKEWDRPWAVSAQSSVGFNGREDNLTLPSHRDSRNANCRACGGRQRGANRCQCAQPRWDRAPVQDMRDFQAWCESWAIEALRVLKPGGHLLAFGGTRTYHRLAAGIEDAGFEVRDCLCWLYGSGFPKSLSPYRSKLSELCQSHASAKHAVRISPPTQAPSNGAKAGSAPALVETHPEGDLAVLIPTGGAAGSSEAMVIGPSVLKMAGMSLSTVQSWQACSDVLLNDTNTSITETVTRATTDPRILNFCRSLPTPPIIIQDEWRPSGCGCNAVAVAEISTDGEAKWSDTPTLIAPEPVISPLSPWKGIGTAAKPSFEPVVVARKPLTGTVAATVLAHGTGALNIDGCRIGTDGGTRKGSFPNQASVAAYGDGLNGACDIEEIGKGRWPANVVLDEEAAGLLDEQAPNTGGGGFCGGGIGDGAIYGAPGSGTTNLSGRVDANGGASRFFYCAKASSAERQAGLVGCTCETFTEWVNADPAASTPADSATPPRRATTEPSSEDDSEWCTTGYGSKSTDPSPKASTSTTSMATSRTTPSTTSCSSIESRTSDSIPPTSDKTPPTPGSGAAQSARSGSRRTPSTTTSTPRDGCSTADAAPAISQSSSKPSSSAALSACPDCGGVIGGARRNVHPLEPTVKPVELMRWLVRLVTPPGGTVLDPFTGSGTTGVAAHLEGVEFLGIEREAEYAEIARARIEWWRSNSDAGAPTDAVLKVERDPAQLDLLGGEAA